MSERLYRSFSGTAPLRWHFNALMRRRCDVVIDVAFHKFLFISPSPLHSESGTAISFSSIALICRREDEADDAKLCVIHSRSFFLTHQKKCGSGKPKVAFGKICERACMRARACPCEHALGEHVCTQKTENGQHFWVSDSTSLSLSLSLSQPLKCYRYRPPSGRGADT